MAFNDNDIIGNIRGDFDKRLKEMQMREPDLVGRIEQLTTKFTPEELAELNLTQKNITSDGKTASYYELPADAKEIQDLISYKNMNGQVAEMFRALYRYGQCSHSDLEREINKVMFYGQAELDRLKKYGSK